MRRNNAMGIAGRGLPVASRWCINVLCAFFISGSVVALSRRRWSMEADGDAKWTGPLVLPTPSLSEYAPADKQKTKAESSDYIYI